MDGAIAVVLLFVVWPLSGCALYFFLGPWLRTKKDPWKDESVSMWAAMWPIIVVCAPVGVPLFYLTRWVGQATDARVDAIKAERAAKKEEEFRKQREAEEAEWEAKRAARTNPIQPKLRDKPRSTPPCATCGHVAELFEGEVEEEAAAEEEMNDSERYTKQYLENI